MAVKIEIATVKETERGDGIVCGFDDCGLKWIMNLQRVRDSWDSGGSSAFRNCVVCPYCARVNRVPEEKKEKPRRKRRPKK